ncbi:MAG: phage tail tape measure protein [Caulobacteraceae bacterium]|nr:MAG: phage tail tape measure protein [Caulobacteraceae bacterium]
MDRKLQLSLLFKAGGNVRPYLTGMRGEADRATKALGSARERLSALKQTAGDVSSFRQMQTALAANRRELEEAQVEARRLVRVNADSDKQTKAMARGLELARTRVRELKEQEQARIRGLQDLRGRLSSAGVATNQLAGHEARLKRELVEANSELDRQARRLRTVADRQRTLNAARTKYDGAQQFAGSAQGAGMSAVGAGMAVGAPLVASGRAAMTFESSMADVRKVVDFPTPKAFDEMGRDILTLSTRLPLTSEGIAAIVASAGQAGFAAGKPWGEARRELLGFAEDAGKMGVAFDTTAEEAGSMMSTWRTAFRLNQPEVRALADQINYLGNTGPASAQKISNVVTRIGALGEVAGLSSAQVAALGATVTGMGVEEEIAATGIKNTMLALTKGVAATKAQKKAYDALGLSAEDVARRMQTDSSGTIVDVLERIRKLAPEMQAATLTQLFGSESVGAIAPLLTNLELLRGNLAKVGDANLYAGSMQKEFESRAATAANSVQLGWQGIKAVAVEVGTAFLPQINAGAFALRDMANSVRGFAQANPAAIKVIGTLIAVVAGGLLIFGGLAMAVAAVLGPFALLQFTLTQAGMLFGPLGRGIGVLARGLPLLGRVLMIAGRGFMAFGMAAFRAGLMLLANPITWIVLGIVAAVALLAGAAYLIYQNWGAIVAWFGGLWTRVQGMVGSAISAITGSFMRFSPLGILIGAFMRALPGLQTLVGQFMAIGRDLVTGLKNRLGIHSPSRVFAELGDYTMQGMGVGIGRGTGDAVSQMARAAGAVAAAGVIAAPAFATAAPIETYTGSRMVNPPPAAAPANPGAAGAGAGGMPSIGSLTINVSQRAGEDMEALAQRIAEILRRGGGGGGFGDDPDDYGEPD